MRACVRVGSEWGASGERAGVSVRGRERVRACVREMEPARSTEQSNLGQKLCNLGQDVRVNVGSHLVKISILAKIKLPTQRVKLYNHACVCSCVGPIVDVKEPARSILPREVYG